MPVRAEPDLRFPVAPMRKALYLPILVGIVLLALYWWPAGEAPTLVPAPPPGIGAPIDSLHGVVVHHNGGMGNVSGRNIVDGYNVGLRYQCVEFVKRYYLERFGHRMPNSYGHAKDFFDVSVPDGELNPDRGLVQFSNPGTTKPAAGDLLVLDAWPGNPYGHVAIIAEVRDGEVEVVQQNTGSTRERFDLDLTDDRWRIGHRRALGWLRRKP